MGHHRLARLLALVTTLMLVATLGPTLAADAAPDQTEAKEAKDLTPLISEPRAPRKLDVPAGDFANEPSLDGAKVTKKGAKAGKDMVAKESFDPVTSKVVDRAEKTDTYKNADGTTTLAVHGSAANFKDASGKWKPADPTLKADKGRHVAADVAVPTVVADSADDPSLVSLSGPGWSASWSLAGAAKSKAKIDGSKASFANVAAGVDLEEQVTGMGVKETIVLNAAPKAGDPVSWRFPLSVSGLTPATTTDGTIAFANAAGESVLRIPLGVAVDSSTTPRVPIPASTPVRVTLEGTGGALVLVASVDRSWLVDPARIYPVRVDPTFDAGNQSWRADAFVSSYSPNATFNGSGQWDGYNYLNAIGYTAYSWSQYASYLNFDLAPIVGKRVISAQMRFFTLSKAGANDAVSIYPLAQPFSDSSVTWNNRPNHFADTITVSPAVNTWTYLDMTSFAANWAGGTWARYGLAMDTGGRNEMVRIAAAESAYAGTAPAIYITYNALPTTSEPQSPATNTTTMTATPTLSSTTSSDPDGSAVQYWFRVATRPDGITGSLVNSGFINSPTWTVPVASLVDGATYYWAVWTTDGTEVVKSNTISKFTVDLRLGDQSVSPNDQLAGVGVNLANGNAVVHAASPSTSTVGGPIGVAYTHNSQAQPAFGLRGHYVAGGDPAQSLDRLDPQLTMNWGTGSPGSGIGNDSFTATWTGYVTVPNQGTWYFGASHDDGITITVGGTTVLSSSGVSTSPQYGTGVAFGANQSMPIRIDYTELIGSASIALYASGPRSLQVPSSWLTPAPTTMPQGWSASVDAGGQLAYDHAVVVDQSLVLVEPSGATHSFYEVNPGSFVPLDGDDDQVSSSGTGSARSFAAMASDGRRYVFDALGRLTSASSVADLGRPGAPTYNWNTTTGHLDSIIDPVSNRAVSLSYGSDPTVGTSPCPVVAGFTAAPVGMLCKASYPDGSTTDLRYDGAGRLARIEEPGGSITDFAYDGLDRITDIRSPLAADVVAKGLRSGTDPTTWTTITYNAANKVAALYAPDPADNASSSDRPLHYYGYYGTTTDVHVAGLPEPNGFTRRVVSDAGGRVLTSTDAANATASSTWDETDHLLGSTDAAGRKTTTLFDAAGRATDSWGPALAGCFGTDRTPNGSCGAMAHSSTTYDAGMAGLAATYWNNLDQSGPPVAYATTAGLNLNWGSGSPAGVNADFFSARFTGQITLAGAGLNEFALSSDDGVRLYIDDALVVDSWTNHAGWSAAGLFNNPTAGSRHRIRVDYYDWTGGASVALYKAFPAGFPRVLVAASELSPGYGLVTSATTDDATTGSPGSTTTTAYLRPELGLATTMTADAGGANLVTTTGYEAEVAGAFFRRITKTLPAANTWNYAYYGPTEVRSDGACGLAGVSQAGLLKTATAPLPATGSAVVNEYLYDILGRVGSRTGPAGTGAWTCVTFDSRGRPSSTTIPAFGAQPARTVSYNYAVGDNPLVNAVTDAAGTITTTLDILGRPVASTDVWAQTTTTTYDQASRVTDTTGPVGAQHLDYDSVGRLAAQKLDGVTLATPTYNAASELTSVSYGANATTAAIGRDAGTGRTNALTWRRADNSLLASDAVGYSQSGRVMTETTDATATSTFSYDGPGRLVAASVPGHNLTYGFGTTACNLTTAGRNTNRTTMADSATPGTTTACYDAADRLVSTSDARYSAPAYDAHGNTATLGPQTLAYDGADRHVSTATGTTTVAYVRDAADRIVERKVNGATVARYGYSGAGDTPDFTMNASGAVIERTVGLVGGVTVTKRTTGDVWSYPNIHGDTLVVADGAGAKVGASFTYDPFGQALGALPDNSAGNFDYGWLGQHQRGMDSEAGINTIEMGARPYVPGLGRFLRVDPVEGGSANDYDYAMGDPVNNFDLDGMCVICRHPSVHINAKKWVHDRAGNVAHVGKRALDNSLVRGVATGAAIGLVCSSGIGCALAVGAVAGGGLGALNAGVSHKRGGVSAGLALGMISGGTSAITGGIYGELSGGTASSFGQFMARSVPGSLVLASLRARWFG